MLAGCRSSSERTQPIETDWSRGLVVGTANLREPVTSVLDDQGQAMHLVWAQKGEYGIDIHYALVDREDGIQVSEQLQAGLFLPRSFQIFVTPEGQVHVLTHAKSNKDGVSGVYHLRVSENGELIGRPELVTPPVQTVESYDAAMLPNGRIALVWESARETGGGLFHRVLNTDSEAAVSGAVRQLNPVGQLNPTGRSPSLAIDQTNTLHLIWHFDVHERSERDIYYAQFANAEMQASEGSVVTIHVLNDSEDLSRSVIGYDDGHIYVFWHSDVVGGNQAGTGNSYFIAFPKGHPQQEERTKILIPDVVSEATTAPQNGLSYNPVSPEMLLSGSSYVIYPSPISSDASELPLLVTANMTYRLQEEMQPMMAVLVVGAQVGHAPVARTDRISFFPTGVRDEDGAAYAVWIDFRGGGQYPIFLASTSPEWKAGTLQATARDIVSDVSRELAFGMLTVVVLIPMILLIFLLPLSWIVILLLLGRVQDMNTRGGRIQFGVAIVIFYVTKTTAFVALLSSPSLLRTMPQPWASIMLVALPALIFTTAAIPTAIYVRKGDPPGLLTSFFIFVVTDLFLTVLIYGPSLYT